MTVSVIIPTFKRPQYLAKALRGLAAQLRPADQIVLGVREGDEETSQFLATSVPPDLRLEIAYVTVPGVIASMSAAAERTTGEIVCLLDDDAEPMPDWIERIQGRFAESDLVGMVCGRDLLQDHPEMRRTEPLTEKVGIFTWYGRILGNHHKGGGSYREVDFIKGCNAAIRGPLLRKIGFIQELRGQGAQVHWELALCLDVTNLGFRIFFDPEIRVIHHIAPRHDDDQLHRGKFSSAGLYDMVWNEHRVISRKASRWQRTTHRLWSFLIGSLADPGLIQYLRLCLRGDPHRNEKFLTTRRAQRDGSR